MENKLSKNESNDGFKYHNTIKKNIHSKKIIRINFPELAGYNSSQKMRLYIFRAIFPPQRIFCDFYALLFLFGALLEFVWIDSALPELYK